MEKRLEQLLMSKSFGQLTAEEKYYVTESIGETEYNRMHRFLNDSSESFKNVPALNPKLKNKLIDAYRKEHGIEAVSKKHLFVRIVNLRMPVWQAAAAIALLLGMHFWLTEAPQIIKETDTVYVHSTDTIYKEIEVPAMVVQNRSKNTPRRINVRPGIQLPPVADSLADASSSIVSNKERIQASPIPDTFGLLVSQPRGQSATQTDDLWQLLSEVY